MIGSIVHLLLLQEERLTNDMTYGRRNIDICNAKRLWVACIEMKLGTYAYYIISTATTSFHDDRIFFEKASGNFI